MRKPFERFTLCSMGYSETAKHFNDIRLMARQLYAEGYKTHNEIVESSSKKSHATENDIKRVESLFKEFSEVKKNKKEKISYVSIDARATPTNPLYKLFRSAKFPDAVVNIYFELIDILSNGEPLSLREIVDYNKYDEHAVFFKGKKRVPKAKEMIRPSYQNEGENIASDEKNDSFCGDTIRNWLNILVSFGILKKEREKNHDRYSIPEQQDISGLHLPISFFSEVLPLGVIGYFAKEEINPEEESSIFSFKHHYILSALDSEIMFKLLQNIKNKQVISLRYSRNSVISRQIKESCRQVEVTPLKLYLGTQGGRDYLCAFDEQAKKYIFIRVDRIWDVENVGVSPDFDKYRKTLEEMTPNIWNVQLTNFPSTLHISFTLEIGAYNQYVLERLKSEGKGGKITKVDPTHFLYENDVYDADEMVPWIRTFFGYITDFKCTDPEISRKLHKNLDDWMTKAKGLLKNE